MIFNRILTLDTLVLEFLAIQWDHRLHNHMLEIEAAAIFLPRDNSFRLAKATKSGSWSYDIWTKHNGFSCDYINWISAHSFCWKQIVMRGSEPHFDKVWWNKILCACGICCLMQDGSCYRIISIPNEAHDDSGYKTIWLKWTLLIMP